MGEIDDVLFELLDHKTANELEEKILIMSGEDVKQHYIWGFEKALEVCRLFFQSAVLSFSSGHKPCAGCSSGL